MSGPFRFSPRPNRAADIRWQSWGDAPFRAAREQDKLILLAIGAVWCHWCHVMDETSYSDPRVIGLINERFIPIRVDNDQRPDVNLRYNLGGWPTTAILTPAGDLLTGGTYLPPDRLLDLLEQVDEAWRTKRARILARMDGRRQPGNDDERPARGNAEIAWDVYDDVLEAMEEEFDPVYGGFGQAPKFPLPQALILAMDSYATTGHEGMRAIFTRTLRAMAGGGMYDPVEGGFFRYSTTRDWSVPHFEKMLEDNALLLECLALAWSLTGEVDFREIAADVLRFLENTLYLASVGCWSGSQDADEAYYALGTLDERRRHPAPYVDPLVYVEWNALLARALLRYAWACESPYQRELALRTLAALADRCHDPLRGMARAWDPAGDNPPAVRGLLPDQTATGQAAVLAFQTTGDGRWLDFSCRLADFCLEHLRMPQGGFRDRPADSQAPGGLARPVVDFRANAEAARWLLALATVTEAAGAGRARAARYREAGEAALRWGMRRYPYYGIHAADLALAAADALRPWTTVAVVGPAGDRATEALLRPVLGAFRPQAAAFPLDPERDAKRIAALGYAPAGPPQAYICTGHTCRPPITDPAGVESAVAPWHRGKMIGS